MEYGRVTANDEWEAAETFYPVSDADRQLLVKIPGTFLGVRNKKEAMTPPVQNTSSPMQGAQRTGLTRMWLPS